MESPDLLSEYTKQCIAKISGTNSVHTTCQTGNIVMDYEQGYLKPSTDEMEGIKGAVTSHGDLGACIRFHKRTRKLFLDACMDKLGVVDQQQFFKAPVSREEIDGVTGDCKKLVIVCAKVLFPKEKDLCNHIFRDLDGGATDPFTETVEATANQVFDFTDRTINSLTPSYKALIPMLDLHRALSEHLPLVEALFLSERLEVITKRARGLLHKLGELVKKVVLDLLEILHHSLPTNNGTEPTIPRYVMKDIIIPIATNYRETFSTVISTSKPSDSCHKRASEVGLSFVEIEGVTSPVDLYIMGIIATMVHQLKAISTHLYKDKELHHHLYTMRNVSYIVEKIQGCKELKEGVPEDFLGKLDKKLQNAIGSYMKLSTGEISDCLHTHPFTSKISKAAEFNKKFEDTYRSLMTIVVFDQNVRQKYRKYIAAKLVPAYTKFLEGANLGPNYKAENIESKITNCFRGNPNTTPDW